MALNQTVLIDYELILSGTRKRTSLNNDTTAYRSATGVDNRYINVLAGQQIVLSGIVGFFFLRCTAPVQVQLNSNGYFAVNSLFVSDSAFNQVIIFNPGITSVSCLVVTA